ncbi:MAG: signal peptide peptidase SppA [Azoarcus sp.]|jgi:protease-4|nr:signal peptide peptidase SppA [Azoarcus sp.]
MFRFIFKLLGRLWRFVDFSRRLVGNLILLVFVVFIVAAILSPGNTLPKDGAVLVIRPAGTLVEQATIDPSFSFLSGETSKESVLPHLLEAVQAARNDPQIKLLAIETDGLEGGGFAKYDELRKAILDFKTSGKPVLARGEHFSQGQYYLASAADEIHLAPDGFVLLQGLAAINLYFRDALDKLGVKVHVFRSGEYKSFAEPFTRNNMSPEDREATRTLLEGLWGHVKNEIAASRKLPQDKVDLYINKPLDALKAAAGDSSLAAKNAGLVDYLSTREQWQARIKERFGNTSQSIDKHFIDAETYLSIARNKQRQEPAHIAVLVAQGNIVDGEQSSPDAVGGDSFAQLIREARQDKQVKAIVLRIDSPGGSAWASEVIRQELALTQQAGKPVIVSMSSVAASGGYWIASASDKIFVSPLTITGSIGVFGLIPEFSGTLGKLGLNVDGVTTSPLAGMPDGLRPLTPEAAELMQLDVDHIYRRFIKIVAESRKIEPAEAEHVARGRVWSGQDAISLKLADQIGGLSAALAEAAKRANLQSYTVTWPVKQVPFMRLLMQQLFAQDGSSATVATPAPAEAFVKRITHDFKSLASWNDPRHVYIHCLCEMP